MLQFVILSHKINSFEEQHKIGITTTLCDCHAHKYIAWKSNAYWISDAKDKISYEADKSGNQYRDLQIHLANRDTHVGDDIQFAS